MATEEAHTYYDKRQSTSLASRIWREVLLQFRTSFPTLVSMLLYKIPWLVSLRFVGGIGSLELAAAALAATICNVTGLSVSVGLSSALTTLAAQARGEIILQNEKNRIKSKAVCTDQVSTSTKGETSCLLDEDRHPAYDHIPPSLDQSCGKQWEAPSPLLHLVYLYRGIFIQFLFVLPIGLWWIYGIKPSLITLGQGEQLSEMTDAYLRILTPGLWSYSINWTLTAWLQAMELADIPAYAAAVGLLLHVPFNDLFIYRLGWGYLGCAVATVMFQVIQPFLMLMYIFTTAAGRKRVLDAVAANIDGRSSLSFWPEAKEAVCETGGIASYLGLAVPGIVIISEWWASEVSIFLSGRLLPRPDLALGAMTLYQSLNTFCFMFPVACSVAGSTRVGRFLGGGDASSACFSSNISILCSAIVSGVIGCILYWTPHSFFPALFAPDETNLVDETARTIPLLALYVFADGIQSAFNGTIKGCGRQPVIMPVVLVAYWMIGIPLAYYISFVLFDGVMCGSNYFCGEVGLVTGMTVGT